MKENIDKSLISPKTSELSRWFYSLEMKGIPYPLLTCSLGAMTRIASSYATQPFKQIQQIKNMTEHTSGGFFAVAKEMHMKKQSFLTGSTVTAVKAGAREYTRFFLLTGAIPKLEKQVPTAWQFSDTVTQGLRGTVIALTDTFFFGPLDRLSNMQVTFEQRNQGKQISAFGAYQTLPNTKALWQGSSFNFMRYSYGWISFLTQHKLMMNYLQDHGYNTSGGSLAVAGADVLIAAINAPFMNVFDVIYNKTTSDRPIPAKPAAAIRHIYRNGGFSAFFRGTPQSFMLSLLAVVGRGCTLQLIEKLDNERQVHLQNGNTI